MSHKVKRFEAEVDVFLVLQTFLHNMTQVCYLVPGATALYTCTGSSNYICYVAFLWQGFKKHRHRTFFVLSVKVNIYWGCTYGLQKC